MFFCGFLQAADRMARGLIAAACCFLVSGPILIIVGIIMLVAPNNRASRVQQYNQAVDNFYSASGSAALVKNWTGNASAGGFTMPLIIVSQPINVGGSQEGVHAANTIFAQTTSIGTGFGAVTFNVANGPYFTVSGVQVQRQASRSISCSSSACSSRCSDSTHRVCSYSSLSYACRQRYGRFAEFVGSSCTGSSTCGTCDFPEYMTTLCAVAERETSTGNVTTWTRSTSMASCFYPFDANSNIYSTTPASSITLQLRASDDPYIALQSLTKGEDDFGMTEEVQHRIGVALLGIGGAIIACITVPIYLHCRRKQGYSSDSSYAAVPQATQYSAAPYVAQPVYGAYDTQKNVNYSPVAV